MKGRSVFAKTGSSLFQRVFFKISKRNVRPHHFRHFVKVEAELRHTESSRATGADEAGPPRFRTSVLFPWKDFTYPVIRHAGKGFKILGKHQLTEQAARNLVWKGRAIRAHQS